MGYFGNVPRAFRYVSFFGLFLLGAAPITGLFYEMFVHLPSYTSILWRGILGASFAAATIGLLTGWLTFLSFDIMIKQ